MLVERRDTEFSTSVYRKPTFTGQYLRWNSFSPNKRKINLIGTLVHRAFMICSKGKLDPELDKIRSILLENGYPKHLINSTIKQKLQQLNSNPVHTVRKCPVYLHVPWIGNVSMKFEKQITFAVKRCLFPSNHVLFYDPAALTSNKERRATFPSSKQRNLPICVPLWQSVRWSHVSALRRANQTTHPKIDYQSSHSAHPSKPSPPW